MSDRRHINSNARHWSAPDAEEEVWHNWPNGPVWSARRLCDDGALLLRPKERRMFERGLAAAKASPDLAAYVDEDDLTIGINLRLAGGNPGRWALSNRERYLSGGFVDPLPAAAPAQNVIVHQRHIHDVRLPDRYIDVQPQDSRIHASPTDVHVHRPRPLTLFGFKVRG